jgi:hypothetical protein
VDQDDKSKEKTNGKNKSNTNKAVKKKVDENKANKKKTPFEITGGQEALPHEFPWIMKLNMQCQHHCKYYSYFNDSIGFPSLFKFIFFGGEPIPE